MRTHSVLPDPPPGPGRGPALAIALSVLAGAALLFAHAGLEFALDDAWISFRIARNWLATGIPTFDPGRPPVEGMTNFLWTALAAPVIALRPDADPIHVMRWLGGLGHLATIVVAARLAARLAGTRGGSATLAAATTGAILALSGTLAFHAVSGLETPLFGLLFVAALDRLHAATSGRKGAAIAAGVLLGLLALTRPEGVLAGAALLTGLLAITRDLGQLARAAVPFVLLAGGLQVYRLAVYGDVVPNTFHAKAGDASAALRYLGDFALYGLGVAGALPLLLAPVRGRFQTMIAAIAVVLGAATVATGGDWMPGFRRFTLVTLAAAILAGDAVAALRGRRRALAALAAAAMIAGSAAARLAGRDHSTFHTAAMEDLARRAAATPGVEQVALLDIGRFGWHFPGSIYDFAGLTDRRIARLPGSHLDKAWDEEYFRSRVPDLVLIPSDLEITDPLPRMPRVRTRTEMNALRSMLAGGYRYRAQVRLAGDRYLLVFGRDGLDLPAATWGPHPPKDLGQLLAEMPAR